MCAGFHFDGNTSNRGNRRFAALDCRQPMSVTDKWQERMRELELERIDTTWLNKPQPAERVVFVKERTQISEKTKRLYFNAGRYAAGDRDTTATAAHDKLTEKGEA